ncbi:MAG: hypothetical protein COW01_01655 [Bdellovibrionales bacterium CG12_big_fil_rev_8_21_14_0_65_38_15]|nr:MAG: hypothetical protein COW79_00205 [Bdellovibrionales bacterium CG22_combo_CG10-13_8_21_14_all_38_13]PIQ57177.1 MAG: hypothetical protein COW01_01655 [Bdellovibrionales bacterium CG12_big_fil_rev_8_21_14_0_65_38_15]PIR31371.1 MAG: hypothetical protein COV38_00745 [Bdellovibrionales bacterium CG11_big_fil_rev_8_21_14_0_20_38_13]
MVDSKRQYFTGVQALRGFAALMVVLRHATLTSNKKFGISFLGDYFQFGYTGVDFFFILSGFVIFYTTTIKNPSFIPYLKSRFVRIFPIYWCTLIPLTFFYLIFPRYGLDHYRYVSTFLTSFFLFPNSLEPILGVAWTLKHEVWFYLLFALGFYGLSSFKFHFYFLLTLLSLFFYACDLNVVYFDAPYIFKFLFSPFNLEFLAGCLIASLVLNKTKFLFGKILFVFSFVAYFVVGYFEAEFSHYFHKSHSIVIYGPLFFAMLFGVIMWERASQFEIPKWMIELGDASYSIYLVHFPLMSLLSRILISYKLFESLPLLNIVFITVFSVIAGWVFYRLVEKPILIYLRNRLHF